ncbi:MAG: DUF808 domain-containing protein [Microbacteriaceae bacterium]|nr:DUF808 domain-containing protein [Burkholderiaceae bacterium]
MATSLLLLLDDIASVLDDVATMSKVAVKKTAGVLGDDLALNAQQVSGVQADRELPVVWAVARGSLVNKAILVPAALAISALAPWLITPLLMLGGAYLCFEGFEKLAHKALHSPAEDAAARAAMNRALADPQLDLLAFERDKVKGAVRTDFILSAEIVVIALGTVAVEPLSRQFSVLVAISLLMTVGVYGWVAAFAKLDAAARWPSRRAGALQQALGRGLLLTAPALMKLLSVVGTAAMFLVGGGILTHGIAPLHQGIEAAVVGVTALGPLPALLLPMLLPLLADALVGLVAGALVLGGVLLVKRLRG